MSGENPFEAIRDPYANFLKKVGEGIEDRGERETKKPEVTKEYVGRTQWKVVVYGSPRERGWSPARNISVRRSSERNISEMLDPKAAEKEAHAMEKFVQSMGLSIRRAVESDQAAAELARGLSAVAEGYKEGALVIPEEVMTGLDRNKPGRAEWAMKKIESAIKKFGKDDVTDILELLASSFC
jgi:hypothetical protein